MKKVLIISYYWYPCGGIGVLRSLKLAKYLHQFGWYPVIYTAENAHYPSYDEGNLKDIPENITILKRPIFEPYNFYKIFTGQPKDANVNHALVATDFKRGFRHDIAVWIRSNIFIPDARAFWIKPSVNFLLDYLKENPVDAIFSDGPPHTNNVIASRVKQATNIAWLADFQDPWTQVDIYQKLKLTAWADKKYHDLEQETFRNADKISIASPTWKKDLEDIGAKNVEVFLWGYDHEDFENLVAKPDQKFTLTHSGLLGEDRRPIELFEVIKEIADQNPDFRNDFCLQLIGNIDSTIKNDIDRLQIGDMVSLIKQLPRKESLQYLANSQLVLLLLNKAHNAMGRIPGKIFEYLAVKRPILCLGLAGSDTDNLIKNADAGQNFLYEDKVALKNYLLEKYYLFKTEKFVPCHTKNIEAYTNQKLTGIVAGWLDEISGKG